MQAFCKKIRLKYTGFEPRSKQGRSALKLKQKKGADFAAPVNLLFVWVTEESSR
jgi:hypothetical protein